ncbi:ATP-binding protein [Streptomyces uncialis]|uniref:ATP-binding protein n=1 Tax=Streptomyces uncialis TaxID=1048205 RepID=UPI002E2F0710|nr:ATP-binding protein [Streptomyces uncialis]WTE14539.1 ATP-binding protein [Streptomyces uncialis]
MRAADERHPGTGGTDGASARGTDFRDTLTDGTPTAPASGLVPGITTAGAARDHVLALVHDQGGPPSGADGERMVIDLLLVTSELVTNAIQHGGGIAGFEATRTRAGMLLTVHDRDDSVPADGYGGALPSSHLGGGYGWPLIIRLARDITISRRAGGGKTITALVPLA